MKLRIKPGSPTLVRAMSRGMSFNKWRHEHTNYDEFCFIDGRRNGFKSSNWLRKVNSFLSPLVIGLTYSQSAEVLFWVQGKV